MRFNDATQIPQRSKRQGTKYKRPRPDGFP
jgi:hypothetical protein